MDNTLAPLLSKSVQDLEAATFVSTLLRSCTSPMPRGGEPRWHAFHLHEQRHVVPASAAFVIPPQEVRDGEPVTVCGYSYRSLYIRTEAVVAWAGDALGPRLSHLPPVVRDDAFAKSQQRLHDLLERDGHALERGALAALVRSLTLLSNDDTVEIKGGQTRGALRLADSSQGGVFFQVGERDYPQRGSRQQGTDQLLA